MITYLLYFTMLTLPLILASILFRSQTKTVKIEKNNVEDIRYIYQKGIRAYKIRIRKDVIYIFFVLLFPVLLSIFRYNCGVDYRNYAHIFREIDMTNYSGVNSLFWNIEFGNWLIIKVIYTLTHSTVAVFGFYAVTTMVFLASDILYYKDRADVSILTFVSLVMLYPPSYNTMRQILAAFIVVFSIRYIEQKRLIKFCITIVVSSFIHTSALVFLPVYFTYNTKSKLSRQIGTILSASYIAIPAVLILISGVLPNVPLIGRYFKAYEMSFNTSFRVDVIMRLFIYIPMLFFLRKDCISDRRNRIYYLMIFADFSFIMLSFFYTWSFRLTYYFVFAQAYLIARHVKYSSSTIKRRITKTIIFCIYIFIFWLLFIIWERDGIVPYTTWL